MLIIGCDFQARTQQIAMLDTETGEVRERRLDHERGEAQKFHKGLKAPALVGIASTGYAQWFGEVLAELGHALVVGDAAKIRKWETRKQQPDRRDAAPLLNLLRRGDFPKIWLPRAAERDVRVPQRGIGSSWWSFGRAPRTACRRWRSARGCGGRASGGARGARKS